MSEIKWTKAQRLAIEAQGTILVSAAAGSGKTAVLVQRVMELLEQGSDIDRMLIVTFTRSAAAQMKEKIAKAIAEKLLADPLNKRFQRQQLLLDKAQITTIDAFCADVVKNNFQHLADINIAMNYQNMDATEFAVLSAEVLDEVLDSFYDSGNADFKALMDVFTSGKNDTNIYAVIEGLHLYTSAFIDRFQWMREKTEQFCTIGVRESAWGKLILEDMEEKLLLALDYANTALCILEQDAPTFEAIAPCIIGEKELIERALQIVRAGEWDKLVGFLSAGFARYPGVRKGIDTDLKAQAKVYRDAAKNTLVGAFGCVVEDEAGFLKDNAFIYPIARQLQSLFEAYENALFAKKLERQSFEFSDIAYLCLQVLRQGGEPTTAALEYQKKYQAILVDEFQDTNDVQDLIFSTIADNNLFVVGDVKQSIYRFRQAMPEIFIDKRKALPPYEKGRESGYILLKNNFRSEKPITDFVNFIFKKIMSESLGDVNYNEDEYLVHEEKESDAQAADVELHLLDNVEREDREPVKKHIYEAQYIAALIRARVESGEKLKIGDEYRPTDYGDYCILVRSKTHIAELEEALAAQGIPCASVAGDNLFDAPEIMLVMSLLRAIDNPLRDVDLLAVMYSELFAFSAEELALMRIQKRGGGFYTALKALAEAGNTKCRAFMEQLETYRTMAATLEPAEFLRQLYVQTSLPELMCAAENGEVKKANLFKFISLVENYAAGGYYSLTGLVRFLEKVKAKRTDITCAYMPESGSKVKIMSVHASKGLEFPVVIAAYTNSSNNHYGNNIVLNRKLGFGIKPKYPEDNARYKTLSYSAVSLANLREDMAEEIRTLYVALTRAKAQLIVTGTFSGKVKKSGLTPREDALSYIAQTAASDGGEIRRGWLRANNNYLYWLCACALMHPQAGALRAATEAAVFCIDSAESGKLQVLLPEYYPQSEETAAPAHTAKADDALRQALLQRFAFRYKYAGAQRIESKKTPSSVAEDLGTAPDFAFEAPAFMRAEQFNAAQRGTATHRFMEKVRDFAHFDFESEKAAMLAKGFLSPEQAAVLDKKAITVFFESELAARMAQAQTLVREYEISYLENAGFFDSDLPRELQNEQVFVDGKIDAAFLEDGAAHIVDYKTDRVKTAAELTARYAKQMELYKRAIERIWGVEVRQCHLYSFSLNEDVMIDF
ncbi:MAG: helicase-exonuclease AddAB subunit AddA [Ruminococcaceae bacterium]|nr:helicase-exonuclease AddAB subunit AddA [Oscillospiraceae bacterium]